MKELGLGSLVGVLLLGVGVSGCGGSSAEPAPKQPWQQTEGDTQVVEPSAEADAEEAPAGELADTEADAPGDEPEPVGGDEEAADEEAADEEAADEEAADEE
ncbi:MAG: hypothetical protein ACOCXM_06620, partial [Myxococcota bacterium]